MTAVRILVVEDEGVAAELIQGVLHNLGHEVCGARRSHEAGQLLG